MLFGEVVARLMKDKGMSAKELAEKAGVNQPYISRLISGVIQDPPINKAFVIAKALETDLDTIVDMMHESDGNNG